MIDQKPNEKCVYIAFNNIAKLYEQISKLLNEIDKQFKEKNFYPNLNNPNAICRWRSDLITGINGWGVSTIVRPYCLANENKDAEDNKKQIVLNIDMRSKIPHLSFGLFTYNSEITNRNFGIGDSYLMDESFYKRYDKDFEFIIENEYFIRSKANTDKASKKYLDFKDNLFTTVRLLDIDSSETLNRLVISPSIELFKKGVKTIDLSNSSHYICSKDYFELD